MSFKVADEYDPNDLFASINPDEIAMSNFQNEPIWRSATLIAPAPAPDLFGSHLDQPFEVVGRPSLKRDQSASATNCGLLSIPLLSAAKAEALEGAADSVPELPFLLMPTHFAVSVPVERIVSSTNGFLNETHGVSYEYNKAAYFWTVVYVNGSSHCKVEVHVYEGEEAGFVVEGNKLSGDSALFRSFYSQLKGSVGECGDRLGEYDSFSVFTPLPTPPALLQHSSDFQGLGPIFRMAKQPFGEAQLEAARTLCDLTTEEDMRAQLCAAGCVEVLRDLVAASPSEWAQQHAAVSLANLSENRDCQEAIVGAGILPLLLQLAVDGSYQNAELRRMAVYILANLSTSLAPQMVSALGKSAVSGWVRTADGFTDERMKIHACRAKNNLVPLLAC